MVLRRLEECVRHLDKIKDIVKSFIKRQSKDTTPERKQIRVGKKLSISNFKFGIELESNTSTWAYKENTAFETGWRIHDEHCGSEIVSPILQGYKGLMSVRRQLRYIWKSRRKIKFGESGLHVHIDIQHFNLGQAKRLVLLASRFDQTIFCLMTGNRWNNQYARRCFYRESSIILAKGLSSLQSLQYGKERFSGLNLHAFSKHGTVEFRYATGSADWQKIYSLISMYLRMVAVAEIDTEIPTPDIVAKFDISTSGTKGLKAASKHLPKLRENKDMFFDFLQLKGDTRKCLDKMFDTNVFDIKGHPEEETRGKIKFSLKRD